MSNEKTIATMISRQIADCERAARAPLVLRAPRSQDVVRAPITRPREDGAPVVVGLVADPVDVSDLVAPELVEMIFGVSTRSALLRMCAEAYAGLGEARMADVCEWEAVCAEKEGK